MFTTPFAFMAKPAGGSWTPADLSNLYDWWNPSAGVSLSGSNVLTWTGYNGNLFSPAQSGRYATFSSSDADWNNNPSITINPSNAAGEWGYSAPLTPSAITKSSIIVAKKLQGGSEEAFFIAQLSAQRYAILTNVSDWFGYTDGIPNQSYTTLGVSNANGTYIFGMMEYVPGSTIKWYASNTSTLGDVKKTVTGRTSAAIDTLGIGTYLNILKSAKFSVVEIISLNGLLSESDLTNLQTYLNTKYNF